MKFLHVLCSTHRSSPCKQVWQPLQSMHTYLREKFVSGLWTVKVLTLPMHNAYQPLPVLVELYFQLKGKSSLRLSWIIDPEFPFNFAWEGHDKNRWRTMLFLKNVLNDTPYCTRAMLKWYLLHALRYILLLQRNHSWCSKKNWHLCSQTSTPLLKTLWKAGQLLVPPACAPRRGDPWTLRCPLAGRAPCYPERRRPCTNDALF